MVSNVMPTVMLHINNDILLYVVTRYWWMYRGSHDLNKKGRIKLYLCCYLLAVTCISLCLSLSLSLSIYIYIYIVSEWESVCVCVCVCACVCEIAWFYQEAYKYLLIGRGQYGVNELVIVWVGFDTSTHTMDISARCHVHYKLMCSRSLSW